MKKNMVITINPDTFIPVDEWDTDEKPASGDDKIFRSSRNQLILPLSEFFNTNKDKQLDYFITKTKRSYNSDDVRNHICKYMNYFTKFFDPDKEVLAIIYKLKVNIDYDKSYTREEFMNDINLYIIRNSSIRHKVRNFVNANYNMSINSKNTKTPNLQFTNRHAKILYEISLFMNIYIPLATHFMCIRCIKDAPDFMLELFDLCANSYIEEQGVYIYNKLYEMAVSTTNSSKSTDKILWAKNKIRGNNPTTHSMDATKEIIVQVMPKYDYTRNIISYNCNSNRRTIKYKIIDAGYEFSFKSMSSSNRDDEQNSEVDRYQSTQPKKDESIYLINKVIAQTTIDRIAELYGPFDKEEIEFYRARLSRGRSSIITPLQKQLLSYTFGGMFDDPNTMKQISQTNYIMLMIAAKRYLLANELIIFPYFISSRVTRVSTRKSLSKKQLTLIDNSQNYAMLFSRYGNDPKIKHLVIQLLSVILSSRFMIIEYDKSCGFDNVEIPIYSDRVIEELAIFLLLTSN